MKIGDHVTIRTIKDIADLPQDAFAVFHSDLMLWYEFNQRIKTLAKLIGGVAEIENDDTKIDWIYDTKQQAHLTVRMKDKDGAEIITPVETKINLGAAE